MNRVQRKKASSVKDILDDFWNGDSWGEEEYLEESTEKNSRVKDKIEETHWSYFEQDSYILGVDLDKISNEEGVLYEENWEEAKNMYADIVEYLDDKEVEYEPDGLQVWLNEPKAKIAGMEYAKGREAIVCENPS